MVIITRLCVVVMAMFAVTQASANCGSAFCSINTNAEIQYDSEPGFTLNLRYEFVDLDRPRQGKNKVGAQGVPGGHDELETTNQNLVLGLDYQFDPRWGVSVQLPYLKRKHAHIHNPDEAQIAEAEVPEREEWNFSGIGDGRVLGRYEYALDKITVGGHAGLKLPTGKRNETNAEGEEAERTLQLGTGSTDLIAGVFAKGKIAETQLRWFVQTQWQHAVATKDDFRPGDEVTFDIGLRYLITDAFAANIQLNNRVRCRDSGGNAESEESGGKYVYISPGLSYGFENGWQIYAYVQVPLVQNVNGIQLNPSTSYVVGLNFRF